MSCPRRVFMARYIRASARAESSSATTSWRDREGSEVWLASHDAGAAEGWLVRGRLAEDFARLIVERAVDDPSNPSNPSGSSRCTPGDTSGSGMSGS